jgi:hypothetical protein
MGFNDKYPVVARVLGFPSLCGPEKGSSRQNWTREMFSLVLQTVREGAAFIRVFVL